MRKIKSSRVKVRDLNILSAIRGECQMGTIKNTSNKKHYTRKSKHKNIEF